MPEPAPGATHTRRRTYAVKDEVVVTGHGTWHGERTHSRTGTVTGVIGEGAPRPLYNVDLDGLAIDALLTADELAPAPDTAG